MIAAQLPGPWEAPSRRAAGKGTGALRAKALPGAVQVALPLQVRPVLPTALEKGRVRSWQLTALRLPEENNSNKVAHSFHQHRSLCSALHRAGGYSD